MSELINLPPQQLPFSKKNKKWRKAHLDWADSKTFFNYSLVRKSVIHKRLIMIFSTENFICQI